jgi:mono/diheme cytochrome c family protein
MPANRTARFRLGFLLLMASLFVLSACTVESPPVKGFVLPDGDVAQGEQVFIKYNCHGCHTIPGVDLPKNEFEPPFTLEIGGAVYRVKDYGELLTAVINPDHVISKEYVSELKEVERDVNISPMPYYGDVMTIAEMIDLVSFLHAQYSKLQPDFFQGLVPEQD